MQKRLVSIIAEISLNCYQGFILGRAMEDSRTDAECKPPATTNRKDIGKLHGVDSRQRMATIRTPEGSSKGKLEEKTKCYYEEDRMYGCQEKMRTTN